MKNELFTLDSDDNNEDLLFRDLDNLDGSENYYPQGAFVCYGFAFVCNIQFILP
jgi:hypothetical protein